MTNQSKWLISAYAIFYCGGVLVPLDYKLTAAEHLQLLAHSKAEILVIEYHLWRAITQAPGFAESQAEDGSGHRGSAERRSRGGYRWEEFRSQRRTRCSFRASEMTQPASSIPRALADGRKAACSRMKIILSSASR